MDVVEITAIRHRIAEKIYMELREIPNVTLSIVGRHIYIRATDECNFRNLSSLEVWDDIIFTSDWLEEYLVRVPFSDPHYAQRIRGLIDKATATKKLWMTSNTTSYPSSTPR